MGERAWSLDVPGLTQDVADGLVSLLQAGHGLDASAVDPKRWLTLHLDAPSVRSLRSALQVAVAASTDPGGVEVAGLQSLIEEFDQWIIECER